MPKGSNLTPKQKAFCEHYAATGNATEAAKLAGYKTPRIQGCQNLTKANIQVYLESLTKKVESHNIATIEERQAILTGIAREGANQDRIKAIDVLNKMTGEYLTKINLEGELNGNVILGEILEQMKG